MIANKRMALRKLLDKRLGSPPRPERKPASAEARKEDSVSLSGATQSRKRKRDWIKAFATLGLLGSTVAGCQADALPPEETCTISSENPTDILETGPELFVASRNMLLRSDIKDPNDTDKIIDHFEDVGFHLGQGIAISLEGDIYIAPQLALDCGPFVGVLNPDYVKTINHGRYITTASRTKTGVSNAQKLSHPPLKK